MNSFGGCARGKPMPGPRDPSDPLAELDRLFDEIRSAIDEGLRRVRAQVATMKEHDIDE